MKYVDGFVLAVPEERLEEYREISQRAGEVWKKYGALEYFECVGDDLGPPEAGIRFPQAVQAAPGELVVFSFIVFNSRAERDRINALVLKDPVMNDRRSTEKPPYDLERMAYGGFRVIVEERAYAR